MHGAHEKTGVPQKHEHSRSAVEASSAREKRLGDAFIQVARVIVNVHREQGSIDALDADSRSFVSPVEHPSTCAVSAKVIKTA
ncbi:MULTISPECIES: hypothetical protein [unclassified Pseudomonas]|jgi:hypothetical protein|uniref:hypothetical protein n=1 Tax=unclassified Pseudomonas TaxID=196821 RepID=UPI0011AF7699|nr:MULTISPECIES: hypothetical protein [unclassified Pseudomonas]